MGLFNLSVFMFAALLLFGRDIDASAGDSDSIYMTCVEQCEKSRCIQNQFTHCNISVNRTTTGPWYHLEPAYLRWKDWNCRRDCMSHCRLSREAECKKLGNTRMKWPFRCLFGIQEPVFVALSMLNLALTFHGWMSFCIRPRRRGRKAYYEYTGLWHVYGILSMNSWFWNAVFHSRYTESTEKIYYSSTSAFLGFALIISIIRSLEITTEAVRVTVAAPFIGFVTTHILFLYVVEFVLGWSMLVEVVIATTTLLVWAVWGICSHHPFKWKLWVTVAGTAVALLLEIIDFPPYMGLIDSHAFQQAITAPLTYIWWSFIKGDAEFTTVTLIKKAN